MCRWRQLIHLLWGKLNHGSACPTWSISLWLHGRKARLILALTNHHECAFSTIGIIKLPVPYITVHMQLSEIFRRLVMARGKSTSQNASHPTDVGWQKEKKNECKIWFNWPHSPLYYIARIFQAQALDTEKYEISNYYFIFLRVEHL